MASPCTLEPGNGLRVLSLDGPDFIAAPQAELFFLQGIAHRWAYDEDEEEERDVRVNEMFDIVGGSGIGGFYAILFTAFNMTIGQVLLCHKILEDQLLSSPLWAGKDHEGCSRLLDEALKHMQSQTGVFVELDSPFRSQASTKCFILVQNNTQGHHPRALRNYRVRTVPSSNCTIRQALHTTLAGSEYLPPIVIHDEQFVSASMRFPNPSRELMKELVIAFPKASHLACVINIGAGKARVVDNSETVAQDLLLQCKDVECFFRLSMKSTQDAGVHTKSAVMELLQEEEVSELTDVIVEALIKRCAVIPLRRLINLAGEDARARRDAQINAIHHNVEHLRDAEDQSSFRRLKDWLKPIDHTSKLESCNRMRGPTTCEWFLEHPAIEEWIRTGGLCWFHGGMGTGKTFIMSHLIQTLTHQGHVVAYYYFEFTNPSTLSEEALLRSLVFQLSSIHPQTILAVHENHPGGASEPRLATLLGNISELAGISDRPVYIAIDALDELPQPQPVELFKTLERMSAVNSPNMHIVVSSRDEIDIVSDLRDLAQHKLDVSDGKARHDIEVFVDQKLSAEKWKDWPPDLIERMRIILNERAAGQFRMVACQLEVLHQTQTTSDLEVRLMSLPKKLAHTYRYILNHLIPEEERARAQMLLRILTVAFEAVPLKELSALIAVDLGDPSDVVNLPKYQVQRQFHQPQNIVGLGTAFVRLTYDWDLQPALQLSHASVKEYLLQQDRFHWCYMDEQLAHSTMASSCLALLLHNETSQFDNASVREYVRQRWFQHVQSTSSNQLLAQQIRLFETFPWSWETQFYLAPEITRLDELVYRCPLIIASAAGLYQLLQIILVTKWSQDSLNQALYVAVNLGIRMDIIELLVENGADVNTEAGPFGPPLYAAAFKGALDVVEFFIEKGANVNMERQYDNESALQVAAWRGRWDIVVVLVEEGADINKESSKCGSAFMAAVCLCRLDMVEHLVEKGADVNGKGGKYGFVLQAAALKSSLEVIEFLIDKGADVNREAGKYGSALHAAVLNGRLRVVRFLVEKGADVNKKAKDRGSVLQTAVWTGNLDIFEFLIERGADVNKERGDPAVLQVAARYGYLKIVRLLIEKGVDVNKEGRAYGSALQAAASENYFEVDEYLVEKGADVNRGGGKYGSALQAALVERNWDIAEFLVERDADVNKEEGIYGSALQIAAFRGRLGVVKLLVEKGADVNRGGGQYGLTMRTTTKGSARGKYSAVAEFPVQDSANVDQEEGEFGSVLHAAAWSGKLKVVKFLAENGADVNKEGGEFGSAVQAASWQGSLDIVEFLVEKGANVNKEGGQYGCALQAAAWKGHLDVVEFLVEKGADVNKERGAFGSALQAASWEGFLDIVKFIVEKGADIKKEEERDVSALEAASRAGHLDIVKFLLEKGADVNGEGGYYGSAVQAAARGGHLDVVRFLVGKGADVTKEGGLYGSELQVATEDRHLGMVNFLTQNGAEGNNIEANSLAPAWSGRLDVVKFLVETGVDANKEGEDFEAGLLGAAGNGHLDVVEFLLK
ncbi:ankyrin repeat-containing domain protein, partial [Flagelloscypha sp. PMI_526]